MRHLSRIAALFLMCMVMFMSFSTVQAASIRPSHVTQAEMEQTLLRLYGEWKDKYLKRSPYDPEQMYVWYNDGGYVEKEIITVSEAHGYGMVILASMASRDPGAKDSFDAMYEYFRHHRSQINSQLMAWQQADDGRAITDVNGVDSATDGDLDIAYALLLADAAWGSAEVDYLGQAKKLIDAIMESEVNHSAWTLRVGDWADATDPLTRSSDFMPQHLKAFARATGDARWTQVLDAEYAMAQSIFAGYSPKTGLLPDFMTAKVGGGHQPAQPGALEGDNDGAYAWNACRFPWRLATDYLVTGDERALPQLAKLNDWIKAEAKNEPDNIKAGYTLEGKALEDYSDLSFTAPLMVSAMIRPDDQQWLNDLWDYNTNALTGENVYYSNTLRLLGTIVATGNWG